MMPVLRVPADILNKAADDPNGDEARSIDELKRQMACLHQGDQSYMILPSDIIDGGNGVLQYGIKFMGIEGSGKMFDTQALKNERKKTIYDSFLAGFLIMGGGQESGSYNLSDNKQTLHSQYIEHKVLSIAEVFNKDFIPQILALNGIYLTDDEMPVFIPGEVGDPDIEANSKMIQRVVAVGAIPLTPEVRNEILAMCGFKYQIPDEVISDPDKLADYMQEHLPDATSRSGDGIAAGGVNGTSSSVATNDTSSLNLDNAS